MNEKNVTVPDHYVFDMGYYLTEGWNLFRKGAGSFIGFTVLYFIILLVLTFIPLVNLAGNIFSYVLIAGVYIFCRNLLNNRDDFGQFFGGFNHFGQIFLFALALFALMLPIFYVFFTQFVPPNLLSDLISGHFDPREISDEIITHIESKRGYYTLLYILILIYIAYIYISYTFVLPLIVDKGLQFWDAMETSRKTVSQKFLSFFGLYVILIVLGAIVAIITCGIGLIVLLPYFGCVIFTAYDHILNPEPEEPDHTIQIQ